MGYVVKTHNKILFSLMGDVVEPRREPRTICSKRTLWLEAMGYTLVASVSLSETQSG